MSLPSPYASQLAGLAGRPLTLTTASGTTHYWEYGPREAETTMVFVHGFRGDHHGLEPIVAQLRGVRILVPDLPGFGASPPFAGTHDVATYATWLARFLAEVAPARRTVLLGHSFGSILVAATLAGVADVSFPPPDSVVLVNPIAANALQGPRAFATRLATAYYRAGAALPEAAGFALLRHRLIVRVMSMTMAKSTDGVLRRWIHDQHDRYFSAFESRRSVLEAFQASVSTDVAAFASRIRKPTLLIAAERDDISTPDQQRALARQFPDAELRIIPRVGHLIHYEAPEVAAEQIRRFLAVSS